MGAAVLAGIGTGPGEVEDPASSFLLKDRLSDQIKDDFRQQ